MKNYIKGSFRRSIYKADSGYMVGLFKIRETNDETLNDYVNKTVTFTGFFHDLNMDDTYLFYGGVTEHERYGFQYEVKEYERVKPEGKEGLIEFLASDLFSGVGEKMALKIVEQFGDNTLKTIKQNYEDLLVIKGMTQKKAKSIYDTLIKYEESEDTIIYLCDLGFTTKEALTIYKRYGGDTTYTVQENIYDLISIGFSFAKIDDLRGTLEIGDSDSRRVKAAILFTIDDLCFKNGDTYVKLIEIVRYLVDNFKMELDNELFDNYLIELSKAKKIVIEDDKYYLKSYYQAEVNISQTLFHFNNKENKIKGDLNEYIDQLEKNENIKYNTDQKEAITKALKNNMLIITGGPGTGKTTIIKAIVEIYQTLYNLEYEELVKEIALIAPTGKASKRMSESTLLPAYTIHRFLKWNKETDSFAINENNKSEVKFLIIDEVSMIDTLLLDNLIKGLNRNVKIVMVGDYNQLPSVGPGQVLKDLIESKMINVVELNLLYRQESDSYIPILADEIKTNKLSSNFDLHKEDFSFIETSNEMVKTNVVKVCEKALEKGYSEKDIQVLCPMYKGENGIEALNKELQGVFNPYDIEKKEYK
ncbi:MAG: AAA family ATPase, partial [Dehalococcoidales bacterium]|nr:AAA family ATPase [Dehalococcoidales bacterium]